MKRHAARMVVSCVILSALLLGVPATARAQTQTQSGKLVDLLPNLYFDAVSEDAIALAGALINFGFPVPPGFTDQLRKNFLPALAVDALLGNQVSGFPLGSSAGGFTWTFDPALGTFNRVSPSYGPIFAERALTVGKNRFNLGFNFQRATFDSIQDQDLNGEIKVYTGVSLPTTPNATSVFVQEALDLKLSTNIVGIFATYGLTNKLDVGLAVPIVHVSMDARLDAQVGSQVGTATPTLNPVITGETRSDSATGIGDIVLRGKYNVWSSRGGGIAAGLDLRLPTGDEEDLLGVGGAQTKIYAALSGASSRFSPHFNIGYTFSGESKSAKDPNSFVYPPPNELSYAGGVDVAVTPRLTVLGDITGRSLADSAVTSDSVSFPSIVSGTSPSSFSQLGIDQNSNLNLVLGSVGAKYNVFGSSLVSVNVLFPLNKNGLVDNLTWLIGFEHSLSLKK